MVAAVCDTLLPGAEHRRRRSLRRLPAPRRLRARHPGERRAAGCRTCRRTRGRRRGLLEELAAEGFADASLDARTERLRRAGDTCPPAASRSSSSRPWSSASSSAPSTNGCAIRLGGHRLPRPGDAAADARAGAEGHPDRARVRRRADLTADVCVVGSGAGGSVIAARLARRAGRSSCSRRAGTATSRTSASSRRRAPRCTSAAGSCGRTTARWACSPAPRSAAGPSSTRWSAGRSPTTSAPSGRPRASTGWTRTSSTASSRA